MNINQAYQLYNQPNVAYDLQNNASYDKLLVKIPQVEYIRSELRYSAQYLTYHKLYQSAKWSGELLLGVTKDNQINESSSIMKNYILNNTDKNYRFEKLFNLQFDETHDLILVAGNLFDLREFKKCSNLLKDHISSPQNQSAIFLYFYSLYMAGEIRKEEEMFENENNSKMVSNPEVPIILRELEKRYQANQLNEINMYLYGIVLKESQRLNEARKIFIDVLNLFPCFWSAWLELSRLIQAEDIKSIIYEFKDHWMKNFFFSSFYLEKYQNKMSITINYGLMIFFKNSNYLINQVAHCFYNSQEFDISLDWFERLVEMDPYRYENMDTYSNILYIKENQGELANLALRVFYNNKYAPETCCVVGNYYSLMGEHLKAVIYFRKALKLDRNCLAAWTLMGHEYLEMKNIAGAVEAYRNAVEIDPKDFRAWYGLGQTYELQSMNHYALYYFTRAVMSRPKDSRMWNAMGQCYEKMDKKNEAVKCYERAENGKDKEGLALHQLGKLYELMGFEEKAVKCFEETLKRKDDEQIIDKELAESLLYLARYHKKQTNFDKAQEYARRLSDFNGIERDEANSIIYDINSAQQLLHQQSNITQSAFQKLNYRAFQK